MTAGACARSSRRKTRQTTCDQELSSSVKITRKAHVFEGQSLGVLNRINRRTGVLLMVLCPDGSRRLIPMEWTDAATTAIADQRCPASLLPAECHDLLRLRALVDALLRRYEAEPHHATEPDLSRNGGASCSAVGEPGRGDAVRRDRTVGGVDRKRRASTTGHAGERR